MKLRLRAAQGRDEAQATVRRVTGELAELAERAAATRRNCWSTPAGRYAACTSRPLSAGARAGQTRRQDDGAAGCDAPLTT